MSPVAAARASADSAPGGEAEELEEAEPARAEEPLEADELVDELAEDPQPTATSETVAIAAAHTF